MEDRIICVVLKNTIPIVLTEYNLEREKKKSKTSQGAMERSVKKECNRHYQIHGRRRKSYTDHVTCILQHKILQTLQ